MKRKHSLVVRRWKRRKEIKMRINIRQRKKLSIKPKEPIKTIIVSGIYNATIVGRKDILCEIVSLGERR